MKMPQPKPIIRIPTGLAGFDRVLGGGLVQGSVVLLGGDPRVGTSTIAVQLSDAAVKQDRRVVYVAVGGSANTPLSRSRHPIVKLTKRILGELSEKIEIVSRDEMVFTKVDSNTLIVVDAVHTFEKDWRKQDALVNDLSCISVDTGATVLLLDGLTKEGDFRGPSTIQHTVDVCIHLRQTKLSSSQFKTLSCGRKNRYGEPDVEADLMLTDKGFRDWP